jgi:toxin ParE1/3/4
MSRYALSPRAKVDLSEIWDYSADRWGIDQATAYIRDLQRAIETVAKDPRRGRKCDDVRPGYLRFSARSHVIFFRQGEQGIEVIRVLHQRMDFDQHL